MSFLSPASTEASPNPIPSDRIQKIASSGSTKEVTTQ